MVTKDDNIFEGKAYNHCLWIVCDYDMKRYLRALERVNKILEKIPKGWNGKVIKQSNT